MSLSPNAAPSPGCIGVTSNTILENLIGNVETTLEAAGLAEQRTGREPAIAFLDLTGFTP